MRNTSRKSETGGFSIAELMLAVAILTIVSAIAIPMYQGYVATAEVGSVIQEMKQVELILENYKLDTKAYPASLDEVGVKMLDPWGNPYQYLPIEGAGNEAKGHQRKDHNLVPINSDFDLYSMGEDGASSPPLTAKSSRDDIVRANNGGFYGYGKDY
ncbi:MAG: prepilin-type cleavage/methylation domain-containing protein [Candidatus Thiodiazotropha sp. (ex Semelilucina semeliformis)]|nr:prepilin-type cleavage/methylation domain-containing protein [Candidatus Thiodiazotropha sp. (ex Semelilucina semeliformis)]